MKKSKNTKQRRRVRKAAYIAVRTLLRHEGQAGDTQFLMRHVDEGAEGVRDLTFYFLHTTKRLAIRGCLMTREYMRHMKAHSQVMDELAISHPVPPSAVIVLTDTRKCQPYGYSYDIMAAEEWMPMLDAREQVGKERMAELLGEPCHVPEGIIAVDSAHFAADLMCFIDRPKIEASDVAAAIENFRARGEPLGSGVAWLTSPASAALAKIVLSPTKTEHGEENQ